MIYCSHFHPQVFVLLMAEMALFMLLIVPMPFTIKRRMFTYVITHLLPEYLSSRWTRDKMC